MERLPTAAKLLKKFSQQQTDSVQERICSIGRQIDDYIENTSSNNGYIIQVLLLLPMVLAMHVWILLGPATENTVLDAPLLFIRLFGAVSISCSWIFGTEVLLLFYMSVFGELFLGFMEEVLYWTIQNNDDSVCYMTNVIAWGATDDFWWMHVIIVILLETVYFWLFTRTRFNLFDGGCLLLLALLSLFLLPVFCEFQKGTSTAAFCVSKVRLTFTISVKVFDFDYVGDVIYLKNMNTEIERYKVLPRIAKRKSLRRIKYLEQQINRNRDPRDVVNEFVNSKLIQHVSLSFAICYFSVALILELLVYRKLFYHTIDFYLIIQFFLEWSTSLVIVCTIACFFGLFGSLLHGLGVWLITWDMDFATAVNSSNEVLLIMIFLLLVLESGIPSNHLKIDIESAIVVILLALYGSLTPALLQITSTILEISNRERYHSAWFYFRVLLLIIAFVIVPVSVSITVANFFMIDPWILLLSSGCANLISEVLFLGLEWSLITLTWYTDNYLTIVENCISYTHVAKQSSCILLMPFKIYCRYHLPSLRAWWVLRAGNFILSYIGQVKVTVSQLVTMYKRRKTLLTLINSLDDVTFSYLAPAEQEEHVCLICFSVVEEGKRLPCLHIFHKLCLEKWLQKQTVCPLCKMEMN